nr:AsmA family protein [Candidatus Krumholzibacteria bacterium]
MFRRKSVRILGVVLAVILLLVVAVKIFLPVEKIRDLAMEQARESLGREVQVGEVSVSFLGGLGVKVADVAVMNPAGFSGDPLAQVQGVDLKLALLPLLKGEVRVGRLVLDAPRINLMTLADGTNNFTFAPAEKPAASPAEAPGQARDAAAVSVDNFSIKNGHLMFTSAVGPGQTAEFTGLEGSLVLQDPAPSQFFVKGDLKAEQISLSQLDPAPELPVAVTYELLWDNAAQRLDIQDLQGMVAGFALGAQGSVQVADAGPTTHLKGQAQDLDLAALWDLMKPMLPPKQEGQLAGRGDLTFEMTAPPGGPEGLKLTGQANIREASYNDAKLGAAISGMDGSVALQNAAANQYALKGQVKVAQMEFAQLVPAPDLPADLTYDLVWDNTTQRLDIKSLQGAVAGFALSGQGDVLMAEAGPTTHFKAQAKDLDLGRMWSLVQPMMPPEQKGKLGGRGDLNVDVNVGPAGMDQLTYQGTAVFRKASYTETELIDELKSMDAELQFNQDQFTVVRSDLKFNSGQFKLTGTLRDPFPYFLPPEMQKGQPVKKPHLDFALVSPRPDVDRL